MPSQNRRERQDLPRTFEGPDALTELLAAAGSPLDVEEVAARMAEAQEDDTPASEVFPSLFDGEPRFKDPELARRLYSNLFGLWDLIASGAPFHEGAVFEGAGSEGKPKRPRKEKPAQLPPPGKFGDAGPDAEWVESAWRHLESLDERAVQKLEHAFENRQDALVGFLDDERLADEGYVLARHLLFELFAMIELGAPNGAGVADPDSAQAASLSDVPQALRDYAEETLLEGEHDGQAPLSPDVLVRVREKVERGLVALWSARKR